MGVIPQNLEVYMDLRKNRGAQTKIAKACGVTKTVVTQWKQGRTSVPDKYIPIICGILGVSPEDLTNEFSPYVKDWMKTEEGALLLKVLPSLSLDKLSEVLELALQLKRSCPKESI